MIAALDRIDFAILNIMQNDASTPIKQIASQVGLAPSSVHGRIKVLRDQKILIGEHAEVDARSLGVRLEALFMIGLRKHERGLVDQLVEELREVPEVRSVFLISGRYDLVVHVMVRDPDHLKNLAFDNFTSRPSVDRIETSIVFSAQHSHCVPALAA